jgi:hypothetical protein
VLVARQLRMISPPPTTGDRSTITSTRDRL